MKFSADGYESKTFDNIVAIDGQTTTLNVVLQTTTSSIEENSNNFAKIYPNPVKDNLIISLSENIENAEIQILDIYGRVVNSTNLKKNSTQINLAHLQNANYFCKIKTCNKIEVFKFTKGF